MAENVAPKEGNGEAPKVWAYLAPQTTCAKLVAQDNVPIRIAHNRVGRSSRSAEIPLKFKNPCSEGAGAYRR
eukprot:1191971-Prorocentrum_minimum.AAC.2